MYRMLIAAAAFIAISLGSVNASSAQGSAQVTRELPSAEVQGTPTDEEREGEVQESERSWVWIDSCWSRWYFVGYSRFGIPLYRRYVYCN
jgi:hypothetical protein